MAIDAATRAALEIERSVRGGREGSLLACVDRTVTAPGGRLLAERIARPLTDVAAINARLDAVQFFLDASRAPRRRARGAARRGDLARALTRLALGRGGPRDLAQLRDGLSAGDALRRAAWARRATRRRKSRAPARRLSLARTPACAAWRRRWRARWRRSCRCWRATAASSRAGYDAALDETRALRDDSRKVIAALQAKYAEETGIAGLKLKHNNVLGYHIDATTKQAEALMAPPLNARFIHRQTNAGSVRFTTTELAELDAKISRAGERRWRASWSSSRNSPRAPPRAKRDIRAAAEALAALDVAAGLARMGGRSAGRPPRD